MDFNLKKEHEMARQLFKDFAQNEVKPLAQETDETETFPRVTVDKLAKYGMLGIPIPNDVHETVYTWQNSERKTKTFDLKIQ